MNLDIVMLTVLRENGLKIAIAADSASKHLGMDRGGEVIRGDESQDIVDRGVEFDPQCVDKLLFEIQTQYDFGGYRPEDYTS